MAALSFSCSACGKCCNSPPAMTVAELLHHEERFMGCLAIGQVLRYRPGEQVGSGSSAWVLSGTDALDWAGLQSALHHRLEPEAPGAGWVSLLTQGLDYPSAGQCPALGGDMLCNIHTNRKPAQCQTVPLDPLVPDRLQHLVLTHRSTGAGFIGSDCIVSGERSGHQILVRQERLVDPTYSAALAQRRADLALEKALWGTAVFGWLGPRLRGVLGPAGGFLTLSLAPVLMVLGQASEKARARCLQYMQNQCALLDRNIETAIARKNPSDKAMTQELRKFRDSYQRLRRDWAASSCTDVPSAQSAELERYLGLVPDSEVLLPT